MHNSACGLLEQQLLAVYSCHLKEQALKVKFSGVCQGGCGESQAAPLAHLHKGPGNLDHPLISLKAVLPFSRALPSC